MRRFLLVFVALLLAESLHAAGEVIAVSDFVGKPVEIGQEIAETLGTDLAKSDRITLVERSQLGQALRELRLQHAGLTEPSQAKRVGKLVGADAIIVGSFYVRANQIVINARVVDVRTGKVMAGRAENVQGKLSDLYNLLGDLANRLHLRLTGVELASSEPSSSKASSRRAPLDAGDDPDILYVVQQGWMLGTSEGYFLPDKPVTVGDFARVLSRFGSVRKWEGKIEIDTSRPGDLMNALRAVVVLTRMALPPERFAQQPYAEGALALLPPWARAYVHQAQQQGYIRDIQEASPHQVLKRRQLAALLARIVPPPPTAQIASLQPSTLAARSNAWTGLVVDARGLGMRPGMSPAVVDTSGKQIYPDPGNVPPLDYIQEYGVADFVKMEQQSQRAGENPVYVRPIRVKGAGRDTVVITPEDAERILQAEKQSGFLRRWRVVFLVD
ncbi:MAG: FlgO family outer membrane protein [Armatimonadota bacterium]|nr:CsgG/HfaB family protein [bacterium]MDW8321931.1 FlgO family outer membrane protein [Armatimonadota bacterium]